MKLFFFSILLFVSILSTAQLKIKGVVLDEQNQPLPYVNIYFKKTTNGTVTNNQGKFNLTTTKKRRKIEVSFVGFQTQTIRINKKTKFLTIILKEESNKLKEIVIVSRPKKRLKKKENPAYRILKEIWKHENKNGLKLVDFYQYKKHTTTEISLNNLDTIFLKKVFKNEYKKTLAQIKYDDDGINYYIPIYLNEKIFKVFGNNKINKIREDIKAEKSKGVYNQGFLFKKMSNAFNNIDIYQNNISLLRKSFVSPISTTGFETYDYVLNDSITLKNRKLYNIYFFPRRNGDLAFEGNFWVADKLFSITKIKMKVHKDINLNFVRGLSFEKEFTIKNDSIYLPKKNVYEGDFTFLNKNEKNKGLTIRKTSTYTHYNFKHPHSKEFYSEKIEKYIPHQFSKGKNYWKKNSQTEENARTYQLIEIVKNKRKIKKIAGLINTLSSGYISVTPFLQFGPFWTLFAQNEIEGFRIKSGFRTFKTIDDRFRLIGHLAYGTKDKKFKYGLEAKYLLSYKPRITTSIAYLNDIQQLGSKLLKTSQLLGNTFGTNALFSRGDNFYLSKVEKGAISFDFNLKKNLHFGVTATYNTIQSAAPNKFSMDYSLDGGITKLSRVTDVSTDTYLTYTPERFVYGLGVQQRFGKNLFPTFVLNYHRGYKGFFNGSFDYSKLQFMYNKPILLGRLGLLNATIEGGKTFRKVPIALLNAVPSNQTLSLTPNTFSLLNYYDFVTDTYLSGHFEHHFNGLILNKIPLIKKLKLRSLLTFRAVYGTISNENRAINQSTIKYNTPSDKIYFEYGFGIENIGYGNIRFFRLDAIWRADYTRTNTGIPAPPKFAIRIGIKPGF